MYFLNSLIVRVLLAVMLVFTSCIAVAEAPAIPYLQKNPAADDLHWDWLQLTSDEWLKGRIIAMEAQTLSFDSDELGKLDLDWEDIAALFSARMVAVQYGSGVTSVGRLSTRDGMLFIVPDTGGESESAQVAFADVIGIAAGIGPGRQLWSGDVSLGADFWSGNTEAKEYDAQVDLWRRTASSSLRFKYLANYARYQDVETANSQRANLSYDYRRSLKWFVRLAGVEYFRDVYQNISSQWTYGVGGGYYVIDNSRQTWTLMAGPGYQVTRYVETPAGDDNDVSTAAAILASDYDVDITSDIDLRLQYQLTLVNNDSGDSLHHAFAALGFDLTDNLDLRLGVYWDHIDNPQADADGVEPEPDDVRFSVGLELEI